jgi:sugar lactone lactonase YvrE
MHKYLPLATALGLLLTVAGIATAGSIQAGDLIVVDRVNGTLDDVNPTTGASFVIASGFSNPQGLAINSQGYMFVSDIGTQTIYQVTPNGTVTTYSGSGVGTGTALNRPFEMAFNASGTLYVVDGATSDTTNIIAIAANGNRTVVAANNGSSTNVFAQALNGLTIDPTSGNLYASTATGNTIYQVTPGGSVSTVYSNSSLFPQGLAFDSGNILFANGGFNPAIYEVDPTTQSATLVSNDFTPGSSDLFGVAVGGTGTIYATSIASPLEVIYSIDPANGNANIIAGNGVGGTTFGAPAYGIDVYPNLSPDVSAVPEPSTIVLAGIAALMLAGHPWLKRKEARAA